MTKQLNMIPLKDLNLTNRFLFDEVSKELIDFLHYLENTTDHAAAVSGSERIHRIHNRVRKVKLNEEVGVKYMQAWEEKYFEREEGREEGFAEGLSQGAANKLKEMVQKKLARGKSPEQIADELEEELPTIQKLIGELQ